VKIATTKYLSYSKNVAIETVLLLTSCPTTLARSVEPTVKNVMPLNVKTVVPRKSWEETVLIPAVKSISKLTMSVSLVMTLTVLTAPLLMSAPNAMMSLSYQTDLAKLTVMMASTRILILKNAKNAMKAA
jgi:hypothetical protein